MTLYQSPSCSDPEIAAKHAAVKQAEKALRDAKNACQHQFKLVSQGHAIIGQGIGAGWQGYTQTYSCPKCGTEKKEQNGPPVCIDCDIDLQAAEKQDLKDNHEAFMKAFKTSLGRSHGLSSQGKGFRCPNCQRIHTYTTSGD